VIDWIWRVKSTFVMMSGPDKLELLRKEQYAAVVKRKCVLVVEIKRTKVFPLDGQDLLFSKTDGVQFMEEDQCDRLDLAG
jgi:hypothetical protein